MQKIEEKKWLQKLTEKLKLVPLIPLRKPATSTWKKRIGGTNSLPAEMRGGAEAMRQRRSTKLTKVLLTKKNFVLPLDRS